MHVCDYLAIRSVRARLYYIRISIMIIIIIIGTYFYVPN